MADFADLQRAFGAHLRNPEQQAVPGDYEDRRVQIYRDLLFNNVASLAGASFPVLRRILGQEAWKQLARAFFAEHRAHTPYFHEISSEFVRFLEAHPEHWEARWPFLHELAHYEWVELALDVSEIDLATIAAIAPPDWRSAIPVPSPLAWRLGYRFPVHRIGPEHQPQQPPAAPTLLLVHRDRQDEVHFQALSPLSWRLLECIEAGQGRDLSSLLAELAQELPGIDAQVLEREALAQVERWHRQDVLLGARP